MLKKQSNVTTLFLIYIQIYHVFRHATRTQKINKIAYPLTAL